MGEIVSASQSVRMRGAKYSFLYGQQRGVLGSGAGRISRRPGPARKAVADVQRLRVLRASNPFKYRKERSELVARLSRITHASGPAGDAAPARDAASRPANTAG